MTPPAALLSSPWAGLLLVLGLMLGLMIAVRVYQVTKQPHPELARKLFHMGGGVVAASLPWLCDRPWPVVGIGIASTAAFLLLRVVPPLRASLGQVLGGVRRSSEGEFFFLASVVVLFVLSGRRPALFVPPVLVLAIADTSAALVGVGYGKVHFATVEGGRKSAEGSLAFIIAAFLCVHVPLLLWTTAGRTESLLIATNVALLAMMAEAIAWRGLDNFFIPFFSYAFLRAYLAMPSWQLGLHLAVILGLFAFVYVWRDRTNLVANARIGAVLFGYVAWVLTGWLWLVPPILLFSTYRALSRRVKMDGSRHINLFVVAAILLPPLGWVVLQWLEPAPATYHAYATVFAAHLAMIALVREAHAGPQMRWPALIPGGLGRAALLLALPTLLWDGLSRAAILHLGADVAGVAVGLVTFGVLQPQLEAYPLDSSRWARQAVCVAIASLAARLLGAVVS